MEKENINEDSMFSGIPVDYESDEPWRKSKYSCSGSGRIDRNFDLKNLSFFIKNNSDISDQEI